jgi:hypothetical protein
MLGRLDLYTISHWLYSAATTPISRQVALAVRH